MTERISPITIEDAEPSHLARYKFAKKYAKGICLDAPCGVGYGSKYIGLPCFGIDNSLVAINHANKYFKTNRTFFDLQSIEKINYPDNFVSTVLSFEGIEHIWKPKQFLKEVRRVLKPDGLFIISTPRKPHGNEFHTIEYSLEEFKAILSGFEIKEMYGQVYTDFVKDLTIKRDKFNFIAVCT